MNNLHNVHLEVWVDGQRDVCALRATRPDDQNGLRHIWFVMYREELCNLAYGGRTSFQDITHHMTLMGDDVLFYDLEFPMRSSGTVEVPYYRAHFPQILRKYMYRLARRVWRKQRERYNDPKQEKYDIPRVTLSLSQEQLDRFCRLYGQGKGKVEWVMDERCKERLEKHRALDEKFRERLQTLENIARNGTRSRFDTASVSIGTDLDGYYFVCKDFRGKAIMNGGLVNHSRVEDRFDWSIHT